MMAGTTEYLNLTAFLRILFLLKMKSGIWLGFNYFDFSFCRSYLIAALFSVHQGSTCLFVVVCNSWCRVDLVYIFYDVHDCILVWQLDFPSIVVFVQPDCP